MREERWGHAARFGARECAVVPLGRPIHVKVARDCPEPLAQLKRLVVQQGRGADGGVQRRDRHRPVHSAGAAEAVLGRSADRRERRARRPARATGGDPHELKAEPEAQPICEAPAEPLVPFALRGEGVVSQVNRDHKPLLRIRDRRFALEPQQVVGRPIEREVEDAGRQHRGDALAVDPGAHRDPAQCPPRLEQPTDLWPEQFNQRHLHRVVHVTGFPRGRCKKCRGEEGSSTGTGTGTGTGSSSTTTWESHLNGVVESVGRNVAVVRRFLVGEARAVHHQPSHRRIKRDPSSISPRHPSKAALCASLAGVWRLWSCGPEECCHRNVKVKVKYVQDTPDHSQGIYRILCTTFFLLWSANDGG
eukprot:m.252212 g.252212  ORF g.252212 m.252212 type:complete len:362 (+) comp26513_c1_seq1:702-1787(+)